MINFNEFHDTRRNRINAKQLKKISEACRAAGLDGKIDTTPLNLGYTYVKVKINAKELSIADIERISTSINSALASERLYMQMQLVSATEVCGVINPWF